MNPKHIAQIKVKGVVMVADKENFVPQTKKQAFVVDKRKEKKKKHVCYYVNHFIICRLVCIALGLGGSTG